jgi:transcriptional regulator of met regulon
MLKQQTSKAIKERDDAQKALQFAQEKYTQDIQVIKEVNENKEFSNMNFHGAMPTHQNMSTINDYHDRHDRHANESKKILKEYGIEMDTLTHQKIIYEGKMGSRPSNTNPTQIALQNPDRAWPQE